jgi:cytochrome c peroxidase
LRNIALTAPYFHDGSAKTLEQAVATMAKYQLGRELPPKDLEQIVQYLKTLTGEYNGKLLQ